MISNYEAYVYIVFIKSIKLFHIAYKVFKSFKETLIQIWKQYFDQNLCKNFKSLLARFLRPSGN